MITKLDSQYAEKLLSFFKELVKRDPERVERVEDVEKITLENEQAWIQRLIHKEEQGEMIVRVGMDKDVLVFEGEVERKPRWIERHVAEIRFGMLPNNEAVAKEVISELITQAHVQGIEILFYFHLQTQKAGISILEELGFKEIGKIKNYYKRNDEYVDRVYLVKNISEQTA
ncbi:MAG: GNAT family N-acetyltransferase [bacterium]|nr:GNAT family N-acetyltransferase [bacterium]MDZ4286071.1 GNAT family N-acetyltransferase [Candidatus Sungbacteria bacterium]